MLEAPAFGSAGAAASSGAAVLAAATLRTWPVSGADAVTGALASDVAVAMTGGVAAVLVGLTVVGWPAGG